MSAAFSRLPSFVSFILCVGVLDVLALGAYLLARGFARRLRIGNGSPAISAWATTVGSLCALLFTFAIVNLWNIARTTDTNVDAEAAALRMVARDIKPGQLPMVRDYVAKSVEEWPELCGGRNFAASSAALDRLEREAVARDPSYDSDLYRQLSRVESLRLKRLNSAETGVPLEVWTALYVLSLAVITVLALALLEHNAYHLALMLVIGTALGILFWVANLLVYPFCGVSTVQPTALTDTLHLLDGR